MSATITSDDVLRLMVDEQQPWRRTVAGVAEVRHE